MEHTELLKKVRKIEIKTRGLSRNIFAGEYHSAFKGRGMAFSEVREYQFGDDIRSIDWNVTARYNKPYIKIFEEEAKKLGDVKYLAQGTLYPDVIESVALDGGTVIKSHHNVGGLPEIMKLDLIEPLRELFKDEVRLLGLELGLPEEAVFRQPFPGPGLRAQYTPLSFTEAHHLGMQDKCGLTNIK